MEKNPENRSEKSVLLVVRLWIFFLFCLACLRWMMLLAGIFAVTFGGLNEFQHATPFFLGAIAIQVVAFHGDFGK